MCTVIPPMRHQKLRPNTVPIRTLRLPYSKRIITIHPKILQKSKVLCEKKKLTLFDIFITAQFQFLKTSNLHKVMISFPQNPNCDQSKMLSLTATGKQVFIGTSLHSTGPFCGRCNADRNGELQVNTG